MRICLLRLAPIVKYGFPIAKDEDVLATAQNMDVLLKLFGGAMEAFDTETWHKIFDDNVFMYDAFVNDSRIVDLLSNVSFSLDEAEAIMDSKLNLTRIVADVDLSWAVEAVCTPEILESYVITDDIAAVKELSNALCHLSFGQVLHLISVLHENFDAEYVKEYGDEVVETLGYDWYDFVSDIGMFTGLILDSPSMLKCCADTIEPIVHFEFWFPDLADTLESIIEAFPHYTWTV